MLNCFKCDNVITIIRMGIKKRKIISPWTTEGAVIIQCARMNILFLVFLSGQTNKNDFNFDTYSMILIVY